jgi:glutaredoxin
MPNTPQRQDPHLPTMQRLPTQAAATLLAAVLGFAATPGHAQFKVIGPDGKVTYTDRPPPPSEGKATTLGARGTAPGAIVSWPEELRQPVARYPVTLYVTASACAPCDNARQLLRGRGIPFTEKQVVTPEDGEALEKLTGGRDAPTLTLGAQTLRGLSSELWNSYLDAAGYPRESRLPANYRNPAPSPVTERREVTTARAPAAAPAVPEPEAPAPVVAPGGVSIKF